MFRKLRFVSALAIAIGFGTMSPDSRLAAQQPGGLSPQVAAQINALISEKTSRTPAQLKMDSQLIYAAKMARGERIASNVATLRVTLPDVNERGVVLDVRADVSDGLMDQMRALGADVLDVSATYRNIRIRVGVGQIEAIAGLPDVTYVQPKQELVTSRIGTAGRQTMPSAPKNIRGLQMQKRIERADVISSVRRVVDGGEIVLSVGSTNAEGDVTHRAHVARATYGVSGAGVRVGVLSDGVQSLAASQAAGDLGTVTVLPGQEGIGDEGTAMLEIIHDLAPNAELYFATASGGSATFAQNIRNLQAAGCTIIVDDVRYSVESPFQDGQVGTSPTNGGIIAQAVKDVAAAGVLYFSSAGNSGNKNDGTSGTWEGDFLDGGAATGPLAGAGRVHNFGGQTYNQFLANNAGGAVALFWSDPLGGSANDYDLFILNTAGTSIVASSTNPQNGTDDPYEFVLGSFTGERAVIVKYSGSARFLHLDTSRNRLQISTAGSTHGHAATTAPNSFGVAATPAGPAVHSGPGSPLGPYPGMFNSSHKVEVFSSDGPRRIFFNANGSAITPGNFSSTGGQVLQKPDFTAADGVSVTGAGGFQTPFFGTSAAAPHAAAIAALVKSRNLAQTATQVRTALFSSAIGIEGPGVDRDSGVGIIMADTAVAAAMLPITTRHDGDFDGDGKSDMAVYRPSDGSWYVLKSTTNSTAWMIQQWGLTGDVPMPGDYDGDGRSDPAVYRPSNGSWYLLKSSTNFASWTIIQWGLSGDVPMPGDYDGDGRSDPAVYRPSNGSWYLLPSSTNFASWTIVQWGLTGDVPMPGDYDGDGRTDPAVYRPSNGSWYFLPSSTNFTSWIIHQWGLIGDVPMPGDYDGDGKTDMAVYRPSNGSWYVLTSTTNSTAWMIQQWGLSGDEPTPGDYDGDGKTDFAVYRPSNGSWYVLKSTTNSTAWMIQQWGIPGDIPLFRGW